MKFGIARCHCSIALKLWQRPMERTCGFSITSLMCGFLGVIFSCAGVSVDTSVVIQRDCRGKRGRRNPQWPKWPRWDGVLGRSISRPWRTIYLGIRKATAWYNNYIKDHLRARRGESLPTVILITDDAENRRRAEKEHVSCLSGMLLLLNDEARTALIAYPYL